MNDTYVECLVKQKQAGWAGFLKVFLIVLTVILAIAMFVIPFAFLFALAAGFGAYAVNLFTNLEFEYLYLDRELVVDKIMAKTRRKRVGTFSLDRIEVLAPIKSYHLDNFKNRKVKAKDYSIGEELKPDKRYVMYFEGGEKIILSPSEEMIKVMKNVAPRKIFND
ncbi:MAG: hypothetical protein IJZ34_10020 [Lachnospiraceae bacterium]|nr:hypothetical protein [Lachnospiraceae bacterium]